MGEFKWTVDDVEQLIDGSKRLLGSTVHRPSSFDHTELILSKPQFINNLILEIVSQQDEENSVETRARYISYF